MKNKLIFFLLLYCLISCNESSWQQEAIKKLDYGYENYLLHEYLNCSKRDLNFDFGRKKEVLKNINLDTIISKVNDLPEFENKIDSVYLIFNHAPHNEVENYIPYVFILAFKNDEYQTFYAHLNNTYEIKHNEYPYPLKPLLKDKNGCGYGIRIITKVEKNKSWRIKNVIINSNSEVLVDSL